MTDDVAGQRIGRYELLFPMAEGGMAQVFAARFKTEVGFKKLVALKRMHPHLADDEQFVAMFLDEGRIAAHISSPHVVSTLDLGRDKDDSLYLVMELVVGVSLERLMEGLAAADERTPVPIALRILIDAATGLADAHSATTPTGRPLGLVHRDVTPHNILIGVDGRAKITDFGIARAVQRISTTMAGQIKGKTAYMAPEQAACQSVDQRSDVFSLGVVAWELLVLRRLFYADNHVNALQRVLTAPIPKLHIIEPAIPAPLADVVARALQRDPQGRYHTAFDFAESLQTCGAPVATPKDVANFIRDWMGDHLAEQEERIRSALEVVTGQPDRGLLAEEETTIVSPMAFADRHQESASAASVLSNRSESSRISHSPWLVRGLLVLLVVILAAGVGGALALMQ